MNDFNFSVPQNIIVGRGSLAQIEKGTANPSLGVLTVECRGHVQRIARQEAYKFETDQMHIYRNEGTERASCFCFFLDYK